MTINTSTSFVEWKLTSPRRSVSSFDAPPYNRLWALVFKRETTIFRFVCRAEVNIAIEKRLQFGHRQHNPWLGPRGCVWESTTLQLVGAVPSIKVFNVTPITIEQDCVSPSEERLTGSQDSWSRQHNQLPSLGIGLWLTPPMAWAVVWEELRAWHGLASVFCLLSSVCFLSVFSMA